MLLFKFLLEKCGAQKSTKSVPQLSSKKTQMAGTSCVPKSSKSISSNYLPLIKRCISFMVPLRKPLYSLTDFSSFTNS